MRAHFRAVAGALLATGIAVTLTTAGPAQGKSDVVLTLSTHRIAVGRSMQITATGGSDSSGGHSQVCIQAGVGPRWPDLRCSRPVANDTGGPPTARLWLSERRPVTIHLRARLFATDRRGRHRTPEQMTSVQIVRFTR